MDNSTPGMSEKIVLYLDDELTGMDKENFERELATKKELQDELNRLKETREAVKLYGLQQKVAGVHEQMMKELKVPIKKINPIAIGSTRKMVRYSIAVAATLLLIVGGYIAYNFLTLSPDKVFASQYRSYELVTLRDGNSNETAAEKAYREKNYQEVLRIHDAGQDRTPEGEFLCGVAALELKNNDKAIDCFREVLNVNKQGPQPVLNDEAEYYLSLSYIRNKDYDNALSLLNKIHGDPNHLYNKEITSKLLRRVKMLRRR